MDTILTVKPEDIRRLGAKEAVMAFRDLLVGGSSENRCAHECTQRFKPCGCS